jgi:hypothetical protein
MLKKHYCSAFFQSGKSTHPGLGIAVEILYARDERKDWNGKPGPQGTPKPPKNILLKLLSSD